MLQLREMYSEHVQEKEFRWMELHTRLVELWELCHVADIERMIPCSYDPGAFVLHFLQHLERLCCDDDMLKIANFYRETYREGFRAHINGDFSTRVPLRSTKRSMRHTNKVGFGNPLGLSLTCKFFLSYLRWKSKWAEKMAIEEKKKSVEYFQNRGRENNVFLDAKVDSAEARASSRKKKNYPAISFVLIKISD